MYRFQLVNFVVFSILFTACKQTNSDQSNPNFAFRTSGMNKALLFTGDESGGISSGVRADVRLLDQALPAFGFQQPFTQSAVNENMILQSSANAAKEMLADTDATMFWFISTHGSPQGYLSLADQRSMTTFNNVASAMRQARGNKAFRRLVVFIEACFAGQTVNGTQAITNNTGTSRNGTGGVFDYGFGLRSPSAAFSVAANQPSDEVAMLQQLLASFSGISGGGTNSLPNTNSQGNNQISTAYPQGYDANAVAADGALSNPNGTLSNGLYEELLVIGSSARTEYSYVYPDGSVAVKAFIQAYQSLQNQRATATINDFVEMMKRYGSGRQQTLQFKLEMKQNGAEKLFLN